MALWPSLEPLWFRGDLAAVRVNAALRADAGANAAARIDDGLATADRLIVETGARNLAAFVLVERAALSGLRGEAQQRADHLRRAHTALTQMGAARQAARLDAFLA